MYRTGYAYNIELYEKDRTFNAGTRLYDSKAHKVYIVQRKHRTVEKTFKEAREKYPKLYKEQIFSREMEEALEHLAEIAPKIDLSQSEF